MRHIDDDADANDYERSPKPPAVPATVTVPVALVTSLVVQLSESQAEAAAIGSKLTSRIAEYEAASKRYADDLAELARLREFAKGVRACGGSRDGFNAAIVALRAAEYAARMQDPNIRELVGREGRRDGTND